MRIALSSRLALLTALGVGISSNWNPSSALAIQFDQAEVDQSRLIVLAAPVGSGNVHKLLILEQLNSSRLCWQEVGAYPTRVDPLLLEFDFTKICGRSTDSNGYSVRTGGEDLAGRYSLRIARKDNDLILIAFSLTERNRNAQFFEIGRTNGVTNDFAKINLDPGWRLTRRVFNGKPVGHIYLTNDQSLASIVKTAAPLRPTPSPLTAPLPTPSQSPSTGETTVEQPPQPSESKPAEFSTPTLPLPAPSLPSPPLLPSPEPSPQPLVQPSGEESTPSNSSPGIVVPTVPLEIPASPTPPTGNPSTPQSLVPLPVPSAVPLTENRSPLPTPGNSAGFNYRVIVYAGTPEQQEWVKRLVPGAFRTTVNGQWVMQAGLFRDRATADATQQQLSRQNLQAQVIPVTSNIPIRTTLPTPPTSRFPVPTLDPSSTAFSLPEPASLSRFQSSSLWATYYYTHRAANAANGQPLLDVSGNNLGIRLSQRDWCAAALEGSVQVVNGSQILGTYNYGGRGATEQVDCAAYYPSLKTISATNRVRFKRSNTPYGEGVQGYRLVPYRTIAIDKTIIPIGSVVYIPQARGTTVVLPSGDRVVHDGYFYAADVGKAIQGSHIDVFLGIASRNPFSFVQSSSSATFQAYIINDPTIRATLTSQHRLSSTTASASR